jgi:DeoR family transcriptional regulator, ulaG and ulaABCDEF operon transcriptional repressor
MHATQREQTIIDHLTVGGFVSFRELEATLTASPATIRRDLDRLAEQGRLERVRGGARLAEATPQGKTLLGAPFADNINRNRAAKDAIGKAAAALCRQGEAVMIDGGTTTLQMCPYLDGKGLQVLTNSLHIVSALLPQHGTSILMPGGVVFREQNIVLNADGEPLMPQLHAPKLFMGAAALGPQGPMQADFVLVAVERRLIARAEQVILLVDSSKFENGSGYVVCNLDEVDIVVTDAQITDTARQWLDNAEVQVIVVERDEDR